MAEISAAAFAGRLEDYKHKAKVLRQIQSRKLQSASRSNYFLNYTTVIISAILTFLSFFGIKNLHSMFFQSIISEDKLEFIFSFFVLALLIASFLQITLRLGEEVLGHLDNIRKITSFITSLDDVLSMDRLDEDKFNQLLERFNGRYDTINSALPPNSDEEWETSKAQLERKERPA